MDVSAIVTRLQAKSPTLFAQVTAAASGGVVTPITSQANLYTLLNSVVSARMYPLKAPESVTHPSIVYQLVSTQQAVFEGYDITQTDTFVLNLRGAIYDTATGNILAIRNSIISALSGQNITVTDEMHDYDQKEKLYRINMELSYTYLALASQNLPAAFVYPIQRVGRPSVFDNYTKQKIDAEYAVLIVTDDNNIPALQNEVQASLLGWQQSANHHEMEYGSGASVEGVGGLSMWREIYRDAYYMAQA